MVDYELRKSELIRVNKVRMSRCKFLSECKRYGVEILPYEIVEFEQGFEKFKHLPRKISGEFRFNPDEFSSAVKLTAQKLDLYTNDTVIAFCCECVLIGGENIYPVCLQITFSKAMEYFECKLNDTIGAELLLLSAHCAVGLLNEFDERDEEKIFVTVREF